MVFSSITFLTGFLPIMLILYFSVPAKGRNSHRLRNTLLFVMSLIFYAWGEPIYVILMIISTTADYSFALYADHWNQKGDRRRARRAVYATILFNLGMLGFFKYTDFLIGSVNSLLGMKIPLMNLPLPIGISFYSFQTMSYTIDVFRGEAKPQKNPLDLGAYVALFPQLIAGPIVRYSTIAEQLQERHESIDQFSDGFCRFIVGLGKKVLIANQVGYVFAQLSAPLAAGAADAVTGSISVAGAWLGTIAYALQIYFDFSGYSDMAIGLGRIFGFEFLENFNYPYIAKSISEFWRRWHISLSSWFKDYVYIPLGGNRVGRLKQYRNLLVVWMLTGIWHGANWNYLLWGLYYAVLLLAEKAFLGKWIKKLPTVCQHVYTLFLVLIGWVIFAMEDMGAMGLWLKTLFGGAVLVDGPAIFYLKNYFPCLLIGAAASFPWWKGLQIKMEKSSAGKMLQALLWIGLFILSLAFLISDTYNPFLYFRF